MKKRIRVFICVLSLFLLTGCDYTYNTTFIVGDILNSFTNSFVGAVEWINALNCSLVQMLFKTASSGNATGLDTLASYGQLSSLITLVSTLALMMIVIQFAKNLYSNYFASADGSYAPTAIELIKKVFVASLATYLIPFVCITGFVTVTRAGMVLPDLLITSEDNSASLYDTYDLMSESGINFATYCEVGQVDAGVRNVSALKGSDGTNQVHYEILMKENSYTNIKVPIDGMSAYDFYCGYANEKAEHIKNLEASAGGEINPKNVLENFVGSEVLGKITPVGSANAFSGVGATLSTALGIFEMIAIGIAWLIILLAVTRRVVDLIVLIGMSWWYVGASVSDGPRQSSIGELLKKLLSICLTQFIMTIEIYIFATTLTNFASLSGLVSIIVWIGVLSSTPTVVEEMVSSTGAADTAASAGKGALNFGKGLFLGK